MNVTEKEATETKSCPMMNALCIGTRCMAWRWAEPRKIAFPVFEDCDDTSAQVEPERPEGLPSDWSFHPAEEDNACWREPEANTNVRQERLDRQRAGYCGLAGRTRQ